MKAPSIIYLTFLFSCTQPVSKQTDVFFVPADIMAVYKTPGNQPPPPPPIKVFYFQSNFIIDTGGHIYFYQQQFRNGWVCGTDNEWNTPPYFIDLKPSDIVELPVETVEQFITANIQHLEDSKRQFAIASTRDTIQSTGLAKIFSILTDKFNNTASWVFRHTTQEENVVLAYKKNKEQYHADKIDWATDKILMPPK